MTTAAAGNLADKDKDREKEKEKPGMRRALGRGLASLLPGPRVVTPVAAPTASSPAVAPAARPQQGAAINSVAPDSSVVSPEHSVGADAGARAGAPAPHLAPADTGSVPNTGTHRLPNDIYAIADETVYPEAAASTESVTSTQSGAAGAAEPRAGSDLAQTISTQVSDGPIEINAAAERRPSSLLLGVAITDIDRNPFQTRHVQDDEALEELANSIKAQGVVQPIVVRPSDEDKGRYVLILGERRLHASKKAGKTHIPAIVREVSAQQAAEMTIIENLQRQDLSPLEQAEAFRVLSTTFNMTQQEIGQRVGLSRASIANYMRLLKLPRDVMDMLATKVINFAQAKELLKLEDNDRIAEAALYAVKKGMSIEQVEMLVLRMEGLLDPLPDMPGVKKKERTGGARWVDPNVRAAQLDLERTLGLRVRIRDRKGKGRIVIEYSTVDDYDRVVEMLRRK